MPRALVSHMCVGTGPSRELVCTGSNSSALRRLGKQKHKSFRVARRLAGRRPDWRGLSSLAPRRAARRSAPHRRSGKARIAARERAPRLPLLSHANRRNAPRRLAIVAPLALAAGGRQPPPLCQPTTDLASELLRTSRAPGAPRPRLEGRSGPAWLALEAKRVCAGHVYQC